MQHSDREFSIIKLRLKQYLDFKGITMSDFYKKSGISNGILSQSNGISEENLLKSLSTCRDINVSWLITGEGDMICEEYPTVNMVGVHNNVISNSYNTHEKIASKPEVPKTENELQAEITYLKRQLDLMQDVVRSKEETIEVLKSMLK